ncbi:hypothetical protein Dxin01_00873 [Deinococcus xinjiangensis]|uniref:Uncharacterized protein n=1 Tax=Deinococcus xinjiangensis TaxID=457454 RepID=A0ABP9VBS7_9DEIO
MAEAPQKVSDLIAQRIVRLLAHPQLSAAEQLDELLALLDLPGNPVQVRSNLRNVFEDAQTDGINLLHPPADFQRWLQKPLGRLGDQLGQAKDNTVNARASTLANFYLALERLELVRYDPLRHLPRPQREQAQDPLPSRAMLERLHRSARKDSLLYAALLLIDELAFTLADLTRLQWSDINLTDKKLIRQTESVIPAKSLSALRALAGEQGLYQEMPKLQVFPPATELRHKLWKQCGVAELPFLAPSKLRRAGLRDHGHLNAAQAGYLDARAFEQAVQLARSLEVLTKEDDQEEA